MSQTDDVEEPEPAKPPHAWPELPIYDSARPRNGLLDLDDEGRIRRGRWLATSRTRSARS